MNISLCLLWIRCCRFEVLAVCFFFFLFYEWKEMLYLQYSNINTMNGRNILFDETEMESSKENNTWESNDMKEDTDNDVMVLIYDPDWPKFVYFVFNLYGMGVCDCVYTWHLCVHVREKFLVRTVKWKGVIVRIHTLSPKGADVTHLQFTVCSLPAIMRNMISRRCFSVTES